VIPAATPLRATATHRLIPARYADRGAWYAGLELKTSQAEIAFHRSLEYAEVAWDEPDQSEYQDFLANFDAEFHDLRGDVRFAPCLARESYAASQRLAASLLARGSAGLVYASVRAPGGTCVACFRPALVNNVRLGRCWRFQWLGLGEAPRFEEA
jgi:hypothetical protein